MEVLFWLTTGIIITFILLNIDWYRQQSGASIFLKPPKSKPQLRFKEKKKPVIG